MRRGGNIAWAAVAVMAVVVFFYLSLTKTSRGETSNGAIVQPFEPVTRMKESTNSIAGLEADVKSLRSEVSQMRDMLALQDKTVKDLSSALAALDKVPPSPSPGATSAPVGTASDRGHADQPLPAASASASKPAAPPSAQGTLSPEAALADDGLPPDESTGPVKPLGQVTLETTFGKALYELAKKPDVHLFFELGTWLGGGTTLSTATGLKEKGSGMLYTMETEKEKYDYARKTLIGYPVRFIFGTSVAESEMPSEEDIARGNFFSGDEWRTWLRGEKALVRTFAQPQLRAQCAKRHYDAINIDGGEFMGKAEWPIVRDFCKPKYIALHDTNVFKTREALAEMLSQPSKYKLLGRGDPPAEVAGWAIFERLGD